MYAEVQNYIIVSEEATVAFNKAIQVATNEYYESNSTNRRTLSDARRTIAQHDKATAIDAAWNAMKDSSDPLVAWIATNMRNHYSDATQILRILPADVATLRAVAVENEWCNTFDEYLGQALEAGVVAGVEPVTETRQSLYRWFRGNLTTDRGTLQHLITFVDAIVAAERDAAPAADVDEVTDTNGDED